MSVFSVDEGVLFVCCGFLFGNGCTKKEHKTKQKICPRGFFLLRDRWCFFADVFSKQKEANDDLYTWQDLTVQ
jgi:hypothetical protein